MELFEPRVKVGRSDVSERPSFRLWGILFYLVFFIFLFLFPSVFPG